MQGSEMCFITCLYCFRMIAGTCEKYHETVIGTNKFGVITGIN